MAISKIAQAHGLLLPSGTGAQINSKAKNVRMTVLDRDGGIACSIVRFFKQA